MSNINTDKGIGKHLYLILADLKGWTIPAWNELSISEKMMWEEIAQTFLQENNNESTPMTKLTPTTHQNFNMDSKVRIKSTFQTGKIIGIASAHDFPKAIFFNYIVLLDKPLEENRQRYRAITVNGGDLELTEGDDLL